MKKTEFSRIILVLFLDGDDRGEVYLVSPVCLSWERCQKLVCSFGICYRAINAEVLCHIVITLKVLSNIYWNEDKVIQLWDLFWDDIGGLSKNMVEIRLI